MDRTENSVLVATDSTFNTLVLESPEPVIVEFMAPGCAPCIALGRLFAELAMDFRGRIRFVILNVRDEPMTPAHYHVQGAPTLMCFSGGQPVGSILGMTPKEIVERKLASCGSAPAGRTADG